MSLKEEDGVFKMRGRIFLKRGLCSLIEMLPPLVIMAEIGCYQGESTEIFCSSSKITKLHAIDPWTNGFDDTDYISLKSVCDMEKVESRFDYRMNKFFDNKCVKMKLTSEQACKHFEDHVLDFVYIDANHQYDEVCNDIERWLPKIKKDGFVGGHDVGLDGVSRAIIRFFGKYDNVFRDGSWIVKI